MTVSAKSMNLKEFKGSPLADCYRNKMEFSFGDEVKDGPLALGMHKRGSFYDVVTTGGMPGSFTQDFCDILLCTKAYFEEHGSWRFIRKCSIRGYLRHLLVRTGCQDRGDTTGFDYDNTDWSGRGEGTPGRMAGAPAGTAVRREGWLGFSIQRMTPWQMR